MTQKVPIPWAFTDSKCINWLELKAISKILLSQTLPCLFFWQFTRYLRGYRSDELLRKFRDLQIPIQRRHTATSWGRTWCVCVHASLGRLSSCSHPPPASEKPEVPSTQGTTGTTQAIQLTASKRSQAAGGLKVLTVIPPQKALGPMYLPCQS